MPVSHAHYCQHCDRTFTCVRNCGFAYDISRAHHCWQRRTYARGMSEAIRSQDTNDPKPMPNVNPMRRAGMTPVTKRAQYAQRHVPNYYDHDKTLRLRTNAGRNWTVLPEN